MATTTPGWVFSPLLRTPLGTNPKTGRAEYQLYHPLRVRAAFQQVGGLRVEIPKNFITDLASTPRWSWRWLPPDGDYAAAAVVHDWFYRHRGGCSRFLADALFRDMMAALGVPLWKRWAMWGAVRLWSWRYWR